MGLKRTLKVMKNDAVKRLHLLDGLNEKNLRK